MFDYKIFKEGFWGLQIYSQESVSFHKDWNRNNQSPTYIFNCCIKCQCKEKKINHPKCSDFSMITVRNSVSSRSKASTLIIYAKRTVLKASWTRTMMHAWKNVIIGLISFISWKRRRILIPNKWPLSVAARSPKLRDQNMKEEWPNWGFPSTATWNNWKDW